MAYKFRKGYYKPNHPEKYFGNVSNIVYRSSWELQFCQFLDNNPNVLKWASEEIAIPYLKPTDNKTHKYYPDFWITYQNKQGDIVQELIEVKPSSQVTHTFRQSRARNPKTRLVENAIGAINKAKWFYATKWCQERNITFRILTEKELFK